MSLAASVSLNHLSSHSNFDPSSQKPPHLSRVKSGDRSLQSIQFALSANHELTSLTFVGLFRQPVSALFALITTVDRTPNMIVALVTLTEVDCSSLDLSLPDSLAAGGLSVSSRAAINNARSACIQPVLLPYSTATFLPCDTTSVADTVSRERFRARDEPYQNSFPHGHL